MPRFLTHQREKLIDRELRLFEDVRERGALDRPVRRDGDLECFLLGMLLHADVTAVLPHDDPAVALERADDAIVGQLGDFRHVGVRGRSDRDLHQFGVIGGFTGGEVIVDRVQIELDRFADVRERVLAGIALADAAGQARDGDGVTAILARFQHDAESHGFSLLGPSCSQFSWRSRAGASRRTAAPRQARSIGHVVATRHER